MDPSNENEEREEAPVEDEESGTTVQLDDEGGDEGAGEEEGAAAAAEQPGKKGGKTRADKKADRGKLREDHQRVVAQNTELQQRIQRLEDVVVRSAAGSRREADDAGERGDPSAGELDSIFDQQNDIAQQIEALVVAKRLTPEQDKAFRTRIRALDVRKNEIIAERVAKKNAPAPGLTEHQTNLAALQQQYPDVYSHKDAQGRNAALQWSQGRYHQLVAEGAPEGMATVRQALEESQRRFGLRRDPPTDAERSRFTGVPRGGGAAPAARTGEIKMSKSQMRMADAAYPHIKDPAKRYKQWASKAGRRMAEANRR